MGERHYKRGDMVRLIDSHHPITVCVDLDTTGIVRETYWIDETPCAVIYFEKGNGKLLRQRAAQSQLALLDENLVQSGRW